MPEQHRRTALMLLLPQLVTACESRWQRNHAAGHGFRDVTTMLDISFIALQSEAIYYRFQLLPAY